MSPAIPRKPARSMSAAALLKAAWAKRMKYARFSTFLSGEKTLKVEVDVMVDMSISRPQNMLKTEIFCKKTYISHGSLASFVVRY